MPPCTVASVRAELCPALSTRYKDYRIERWIAQKKGNQAEVVKAILAQRGNDDRLELILTDPKRRKETLEELSRKVLNVIHNPSKHELVLYINTRNQAPQFNEQREGDALLITMHYLLHRIEVLEGEGGPAICVIDKTEAESPKLSEMEGKVRMFNNVMFRSFPGTFSNTYLCCSWGAISRKTVSSLAKGFGVPAEFVTPAELISKIGKACTPTSVGGEYYLDAGRPMDVLVAEFIKSAEGKKIVATPAVVASCTTSSKWSEITSQPLRIPQKAAAAAPASVSLQQNVLLAAGAVSLVAAVLGQYLAVLLILGGVAYVLQSGQGSPEPSSQPLASIVRCILDSQYSECMGILESCSGSVSVQDLNSDNQQDLQMLALAITASLRIHQKDRLKRCFKSVFGITAMMVQLEDNLELSLAKWERLFRYIQAVGALQVPCPCGCNGQGDLDWLDTHFDGAPSSRTAVIAQLGRVPDVVAPARRVSPIAPSSPEVISPRHIGRFSRSPLSFDASSNGLHAPRSPVPVEAQSPIAHHEKHLWMKDWKEQWGQRKDEWKEEWEHRRTDLANKYRRSPSANQQGRTTPLAGALRFRTAQNEGSMDAGGGWLDRASRHFSPLQQER